MKVNDLSMRCSRLFSNLTYGLPPCLTLPISNNFQTGTPFQGIMAIGLTQPALAALILIGKHATLNP
jgi:hypothetical protein